MAIQEIYNCIIELNMEPMADLVRGELDAGAPASGILREGMIAALDEVGNRFAEGKMYIPEMLFAAQVFNAGLEVLKPHLVADDTRSAGTVVIGTVKGDLHDIGKNLVTMMLEGGGFKVIDLGVDVETSAFLEAAKADQADILALSALLTTTMPAMKETVAKCKGEEPGIRIMVGGAPVSHAYAKEIGADGYADDAPGAVRMARQLLGG
ncbi:MAG: cobalamin-dependent protein [Thermodesulfobacteriota bacterium]